MLVLRIIATIIMGISCLTCAVKNINIFSYGSHPNRDVIIVTICGWLWRAFIIVAIWLI